MRATILRFTAFVLTGFCAIACGGTGGGYTDAGMTGEYFANADLQGEPRFVRKDIRLMFDWETLLPVGGSTSEPYKSFPHDNFIVDLFV